MGRIYEACDGRQTGTKIVFFFVRCDDMGVVIEVYQYLKHVNSFNE